jgi:AraC family transcriptional regulator
MAHSSDHGDKANPSDEEGLIRAHLTAISWIETHLLEPMTVKSIADRAGYSPSRFSRGFTRLQGESVMSYVRGRRLEAAMRRLLTEPEAQIVDLAFDSGFDSQEAFTRAFARAFGHPPGRMRSLGPVTHMVRAKKTSTLEPEVHERVERTPELRLVGLVHDISPANAHDLPQVWKRLDTLRDFPGVLDASTYSLLRNIDPRDGSVEMLSAMRIAPDAVPPAGLQQHLVAAARCAVYRLVVRKGDVFPQVNAGRDHIYSKYASKLLRAAPPLSPFAVFPQGLNVTAGSWVDYYFPIAE